MIAIFITNYYYGYYYYNYYNYFTWVIIMISNLIHVLWHCMTNTNPDVSQLSAARHRGIIWLLRGLIQEDLGCQWLCRAKGLWLDWSSCCMPEWWRMQVEPVETVETWDLATLGRDVRWFPSTSPKRWKTRSASPWFTDTARHVATKNRRGSCNALVYICSNKIQQTSMLHRTSCTESQSLKERLH